MPPMPSPGRSRPPRRRWRIAASLLFALLLLGAFAAPVAHDYVRAVVILERFADPDAKPRLAALVDHPVDVEVIAFQAPHGLAPARIYRPRGAKDAPGVVILHGVHFAGMDEPRLASFSRAIAATGIVVMTPGLDDLARFQVTPQSVGTIGAAAEELARRLGRKVGVIGLSYAGGLALLAAAEPQYAPSVAYVLAIGAHADMERVARFYATDDVLYPDGHMEKLRAHPYGAMVLIYSAPQDFFSGREAGIAREALRLALREEEAPARAEAAKLSRASRERLEALAVQWNAGPLRQQLLASIDRHAAEMQKVSPAGKLGGLTVPVYLLHGQGDTIIPAAETDWLAREVPPEALRAALVSPAISHVETSEKPTREDELRLVRFLAGVLDAGD